MDRTRMAQGCESRPMLWAATQTKIRRALRLRLEGTSRMPFYTALVVAFLSETYPASRATPAATRSAAIQRRRSTFSCRKIFAAKALPTKVSEAEAGATTLNGPHDS